MKKLISVLIVGFCVAAYGSVTVTVNGTSHTIPQKGEKGWGDNVTAWIQDISGDVLYPSGGTFTLTSDVNFGATYGLKSAYFSSRGNASSGGLLRLANTDSIGWRNGADSANLLLSISSDKLQFDSVDLITDVTGLSSLSAVEIDQLENIGSSTISATQWGYLGGMDQDVITTSDVTFNSVVGTGLTASRVVVTDGSKTLSSSSVTSTELAFLSGLSDVLSSDNTKTLTNKNIDADDNTVSDLTESNFKTQLGNADTVLNLDASGIAQFTQVDTDLISSSGASDGQVLTSDGSGATAWEDIPGSTLPTIQKFTSGSGTYTTPANVRYIKITMVGGGGGGGGSGTSSGTAASAGGNTTFGTSLLSAGGGSAGARDSDGAAGGTSSLGTGPIGLAISGGRGGGSGRQNSGTILTQIVGGDGGSTVLGGSGSGGSGGASGAGLSGAANTGGGGGGAYIGFVSSGASGSGGGAGGYVQAIINSPSASYSYAVGSGGSGATAGTSGAAGGDGGSGVIVVEEYY